MSSFNVADIPKLTGPKNYALWRTLIAAYINLEPGDGDNGTRSEATTEDRDRYIILTTMDPIIAENIVHFSSSHKMLDALHTVYGECGLRNWSQRPDVLADMNPSDYKTFDSFMWAYVGEAKKQRDPGYEEAINRHAVSSLCFKIENSLNHFSTTLDQEDAFLKMKSDLYLWRNEPLMKLVGWLSSIHREIVCFMFGWDG